jgi:hypothetical protein
MWAKLDDGLLDHPKILRAGELIGKRGALMALGLYTSCILYVNKHLTDGFLSPAALERLSPRADGISDALIEAGLLDSAPNGFRIHDYLDHNPTSESVRKKRAADRERKRNAA